VNATPYCDVAAKACVECLTDRNCGAGSVCNTITGRCEGCRTDADCPSYAPYCDSANHCVECMVDANCGSFGIACVGGQCGSCGDGICGPNERIKLDYDPSRSDIRVSCAEDCDRLCPTKDLGSALGTFTVDGSRLQNLFSDWCSLGHDGVDASFQWRAPFGGSFSFQAEGASLATINSACLGLLNAGEGCAVIPGADSGPQAIAGNRYAEGDYVTIVVETGRSHVDHVTITIACMGSTCPGADASTDAGDPKTNLCLDNAEARGDGTCSGVTCACASCPQDYDDCAVIPGCRKILECLGTEACDSSDCYASSACRSIVDSYGGETGPAFATSLRVRACEANHGCTLPCATEAGVNDVSPSDAGLDGAADADAGPAPPEPAIDACDCTVGRAHSGLSRLFDVVFALTLATAIGARRRRQRSCSV
jgi:hypothetical protein